MWPKNFNSIHFFRLCSHEKPLPCCSDDISSSTPKYANSTMVNNPNMKLIILTHAKAVVFRWPFEMQVAVAAVVLLEPLSPPVSSTLLLLAVPSSSLVEPAVDWLAVTLHLLAATQASSISASEFRKWNSTKVKIPIDSRTAASWKLRPCSDDETRYVRRIALNLP